MAYRIAPTRIPGRSGRSVVVMAVTVAVAFGLGLAFLTVDRGPDASIAVTNRSAEPSGSTPVATAAPDVRCHGIGAARCTEVATAAVGAIVDPTLPPAAAVTSIDVWASLLCSSTFDCPPYHMADRRPAGSAVLTTGSGTVLWVNVTEIVLEPDRGSPLPKLDAWVIPSGPAS